ncbi:hypothetical protein N8I77_003003 [Diaporthe amygdali]|uniref:Uncharacterized protein n=1 Tax=Phomopsis amygdali TaxID=1214568 RepID=A0AAD9W783_PHOAM|nr:hypothetical protein N8I77_003003 [Diaporthe amygdali]
MKRAITESRGLAHLMAPLPGEPLPSGVTIMSIKDWRRLNELDQRYDPKAKDKAQAKEPTREMIENEIKEICEDLVLASIVTPESSKIQERLHEHVCGSRDVRSALSSSVFFASFMQKCPRGLMETLTLRWIREHSLIDYRNSD